jgi:hypothetical protein
MCITGSYGMAGVAGWLHIGLVFLKVVYSGLTRNTIGACAKTFTDTYGLKSFKIVNGVRRLFAD